jgi:hypothetical protein
MLVLKNILRKNRDSVEEFEDFLTNITFDSISEIDAKAAYIWILGEFGSKIDMAPYILERMIEVHKDLQSVEISMELLTSFTKLFFTRPPEVKATLGKFMKYAISENNDVDLRDRATFYYKLLQSDLSLARQIICSEDVDADKIFENNFTTSYTTHDEYLREEVLKIKSKQVKKPQKKKTATADEDQDEPQEDLIEQAQDDEDAEQLIDFGEEPSPQPVKKQESEHYMPSDNLLDGDDDPFAEESMPKETFSESKQNDDGDLLDMGPSTATSQPTKKDTSGDMIDLSEAFGSSSPAPQMPTQPTQPKLELKSEADLDPNAFQQKWMSLQAYPNITRKLNAPSAPTLQMLCDRFSQNKVFCMASGNVNNFLKLYLYSQPTDGGVFLMEFMLNTQTLDYQITMKSDRNDIADAYGHFILSLL